VLIGGATLYGVARGRLKQGNRAKNRVMEQINTPISGTNTLLLPDGMPHALTRAMKAEGLIASSGKGRGAKWQQAERKTTT
jgi:phage terminase large subunit GpA-like protein